MRRRLLIALVVVVLVVSVFLYVFFEVPLVKGVRREPVGLSSSGFAWYVTYHDEGILHNEVFIPGQNMTVGVRGTLMSITVPRWTPLHKVPDEGDFKAFERFLREELKIKPEEIDIVLFESGTYLYYEYECSLSYQYFGIGYYRERLLYQFFQ